MQVGSREECMWEEQKNHLEQSTEPSGQRLETCTGASRVDGSGQKASLQLCTWWWALGSTSVAQIRFSGSRPEAKACGGLL